MFVVLPPSFGGAEASADPPGDEVAKLGAGSGSFDCAMDRALGKATGSPPSIHSATTKPNTPNPDGNSVTSSRPRPSPALSEGLEPASSETSSSTDGCSPGQRFRPKARPQDRVSSEATQLAQIFAAAPLLPAPVPAQCTATDITKSPRSAATPATSDQPQPASGRPAAEAQLPASTQHQGTPSNPGQLSGSEPQQPLAAGHQTKQLAPEPANPGSAKNPDPAAELVTVAGDPKVSAQAASSVSMPIDQPAPVGSVTPARESAHSAPAAPSGTAGTASAQGSSAGIGGDPPGLGTPVAQLELPMKKAQKMPKTAESPLQNLPSAGAGTAGPARPTAELPPAANSPEMEKLMAATGAGPLNPGLEPVVNSIANGPGANDTRLAALERTHDLVSLHALRLSQSGSDSMRVVLEPGGGTRLSLELRFANNGIEAAAMLHHGDFQFLSSHWAELQQRLEPRGVHLGDLGFSDAPGNGQSHQSTHEPAEESSGRSAFAEFALNGPMADSPAKRGGRTKTHAGWETWA